MEIVVTGTEEWAMDSVRRMLRAAGHGVYSCFDDPRSARVCNGSRGPERCPGLSAVDVIVAVRAHPLPHLTAQERSTRCPMLSGVAVVVAGSALPNPFGERVLRMVESFDDIDDIEGACRETRGPVGSHP